MSASSRLVAFAALLVSGACGASRTTARSHVDQSVLTQEQLEERHFENLLEAVQTLRANWLNDRGPDSFVAPSHIWVYVDNTRFGGVQTLAQLGTRNISLVRKLNGVDATARWGIGHSAGVIAVMTWPPQNDPSVGVPRPPADSANHTD
jgi:hypothetical protein